MSQKNHNNLIRSLKKTGYTISGPTKIGFVLNNLGTNQVAFTCIDSCNKWLRENSGTALCAFYEDSFSASILPEFARFHLRDINIFDGHLVATDVNSALAVLNAPNKRKYFYIQDLEYLRPKLRYKEKLFDNIMNDNSILKFTRSWDYTKKLSSMGYKIHHEIVKDFDIRKILELVNNGK